MSARESLALGAIRAARAGLTALAAGLALTTHLVGCAHSSPSEHESAAPQAKAVASAAPLLDGRTRGWEAGQWYSYTLELTTAVSFGSAANAFDFTVSGVVEITPTTVTPDAVTIYLALSKPKIVSRVAGSQAEYDKVAEQLASTGCFFTLRGGLVTAMHVPRGLSPTAANTYREIGAALQFVRSDQAASYTAEEYDTTGQYVAEYRAEQAGSSWHKRKEKYVGILAARTAPTNLPAHVVPKVEDSDGEIQLYPDGRPKTVSLRDSVSVDGAQQPVHSTTTVSLRAGSSAPAHEPAPDWTALMAGMRRFGAEEPYGGEASVESLDAARIGSMTFEKAVAGLERLSQNKQKNVLSSVNGSVLDLEEESKRKAPTQEESALFTSFAAILREDPKAVSATVAKIRAKSAATEFLIAALGSASSPASERALVELANENGTDPTVRTRALLALSRTPRPSQAAIDALKAMLVREPFNEPALLGLGTFSRRLRDSGDDKQAAALGALLVDKLAAARSTLDRLTVLRSIANSGYAPALPRVTPYLSDEQELVRVAAVRSLQSMRDPTVDDVIAKRLEADPSADVRISALSAAKVREPSDALVSAVQVVASSGSDARVRYRAVEVLTSWLASRSDLRSALERIAQSDTEARVRDRAQQAL